MSFDHIIKFLDDWSATFGGFIEFASQPLSNFVPSWMEVTLPEVIAQQTLFGFMFGAGFITYLAVILIKFVLDTLPVV